MVKALLAGKALQMRMSFGISLSDDIFAKGIVNDVLAEVLESAFQRVRPHLHRHPRDFQWGIFRSPDKADPFNTFTRIACRFEVDEEVPQNFVGIVHPDVLQQIKDLAVRPESIIPVNSPSSVVATL